MKQERVVIRCNKKGYKILVFSDLHLGHPKQNDLNLAIIISIIKKEKPNCIIFAGDIFEDRMSSVYNFLAFAEICNLVEKVIILRGNHDSHFAEASCIGTYKDSIPSLFYGDVAEGIIEGKSFVIEHGHMYDFIWRYLPFVGKICVWFHIMIYIVFGFDFQGWFRSFSFVKKGLKKQHRKARKRWNTDIVITGHTHLPVCDKEEGYFNSGDWLQHKSYVLIKSGKAELREMN